MEQGTGFSNYPTSLRFEYSNDNMGWQVGETVSVYTIECMLNITALVLGNLESIVNRAKILI